MVTNFLVLISPLHQHPLFNFDFSKRFDSLFIEIIIPNTCHKNCNSKLKGIIEQMVQQNKCSSQVEQFINQHKISLQMTRQTTSLVIFQYQDILNCRFYPQNCKHQLLIDSCDNIYDYALMEEKIEKLRYLKIIRNEMQKSKIKIYDQ
ncbi:hypothetical protein pb186bvf_017403 [Paramecium bursaria]